MAESFAQKLTVGGKTNSLGQAAEVVQTVLHDKTRLVELYGCLSEPDAWIRMRAADSLEKVCRIHPDWFESFVDRLLQDMGSSTQPSLLWHVAQMLGEISLTPPQQQEAAQWLENQLQHADVDWIVAANVMSTLVVFTKNGCISKDKATKLIKSQQDHHSESVRKRAAKLLTELEKL
jgi:hypothetical protein